VTPQAARAKEKIVPTEELSALVGRLRADGKTIVHAHGVFDLLHIGHIRHFAEAKSLGDVLIVTVTEDRYVNKGPNRPAFTDSIRLEALAALDDIDYVAVSRWPTAIEVLDLVRPDVYIKGPDYRNAADDKTGGILAEEAAVQKHGGRIHFSEDVTYSSTTLINRFFPTFDAPTEAYLADFRSRYSARDVVEAVESLASIEAVVVGEAILDEYVYCAQMGKSAKEPVLAMRYESREMHAGGALAVANHVASFCKSVELVTYLGHRDPYEDFVRLNLRSNVRPNFIYKTDSPTIVKRRYVESYLLSKLFEVYVFNDEPLEPHDEDRLVSLLEARIADADLVLAADFGHGLITERSVDLLANSGRFLAVNTQINAANIGFHAISKYPRADYICVHEGEVRLDSRKRRGPLAPLIADLSKRMTCDRILVTRGKNGVSYFEDGVDEHAPAFAGKVVDRVGSGDAVLALTSLCVAAKLPAPMISFLANVAGAQKLQIMGNKASLDKVQTLRFIDALLK
jgi:rfaE bifunctional protein nucleotidyltransferase chain/domain